MSKYVEFSEIPVHGGGRLKWPYEAWLKEIPPGCFLEVTSLLNGSEPRVLVGAVAQYARVHNVPLRGVARGQRVWVGRKAEPDA